MLNPSEETVLPLNKTVVLRNISPEAVEWLLAPESIRHLTAYVEKRALVNKPSVKEFAITHKAASGRKKVIVLGTSAQQVKVKFRHTYEIISVRAV